MKIPEAQRAKLSGYVQPGQLLPWAWLDARMERARNYWITTHSARYPSSRPVWGIWRSPTLVFSTGSQIARNIARDGRVQVNLESADEVVVIEGIAEPLIEQIPAETWAGAYNEKYNWDMPAEINGVYVVKPTRVLAWLSDSSGLDRGATFSNSATEWRFT